MSLIEETYHEELEEKRKVARSATSYISKSFRHRLRSAIDLMTPYQRKKHKEAGKVEVRNMYDVMISREQFDKLSDEDMKKHLIEYRKRFDNDAIIEHFGMYKKAYFDLVRDLGLPKAPKIKLGEVAPPRKHKPRGGISKKSKPEPQSQLESIGEPISLGEILPKPVVLPKVDGMQFNYTGVYSPNQILSKLEKLSLLLSDEENKFDIKIFIQETEDKVENVG